MTTEHIRIRNHTGKKGGFSIKESPAWTVELVGIHGQVKPLCSGMNEWSTHFTLEDANADADAERWRACLGWEIRRVKTIYEVLVTVVPE